MQVLHNKVSNKELKARMLAETTPRTTISFYKYFRIQAPHEFRDLLYQKFNEHHVFGRVYIAQEGINGQISVPEPELEAFRKTLYSLSPELDGLRLNIAVDDDGKSFWVLKVKVRDKIVADGIDDPNFDPSKTGTFLKAEEVNKMNEDPNVVFVDMRNHYEYEVGHFDHAIEIPSDTFREQLPMAAEMLEEDKDKKIVMYCTGGIRCEKASAYLIHKGFKNVYAIDGGIIEYARDARKQHLPMKFIGKNFVFDARLGERVTDDVIAHCHQCGKPCDRHVNCNNDGCHLLFIQCDECAKKYDGCCSEECMLEHHLPEEEQKKLRTGRKNGLKIFNKSKDHPLRIKMEEHLKHSK